MSEVPTPVSESTAIEVVRKEGSALSWKAIDTIVAGALLYQVNASGVDLCVGTISSPATVGVALSQASSGGRVTTIRGKVRAIWDGAGTLTYGTVIGNSTTQSGYFTPGANTSGAFILGTCIGTGPGFLATGANSGQLVVVNI